MALRDDQIRAMAIIIAKHSGFPNAAETWDDPTQPPSAEEKAKFLAMAEEAHGVPLPFCPPMLGPPPPE